MYSSVFITQLLASQLGLLIFNDMFSFLLPPSVISIMFIRLASKTCWNDCDFFLRKVKLDVCKKLYSLSGVKLWL